jgi:hypothetical protein
MFTLKPYTQNDWHVFCAKCKQHYEQRNVYQPARCGACGSRWIAVITSAELSQEEHIPIEAAAPAAKPTAPAGTCRYCCYWNDLEFAKWKTGSCTYHSTMDGRIIEVRGPGSCCEDFVAKQ